MPVEPDAMVSDENTSVEVEKITASQLIHYCRRLSFGSIVSLLSILGLVFALGGWATNASRSHSAFDDLEEERDALRLRVMELEVVSQSYDDLALEIEALGLGESVPDIESYINQKRRSLREALESSSQASEMLGEVLASYYGATANISLHAPSLSEDLAMRVWDFDPNRVNVTALLRRTSLCASEHLTNELQKMMNQMERNSAIPQNSTLEAGSLSWTYGANLIRERLPEEISFIIVSGGRRCG